MTELDLQAYIEGVRAGDRRTMAKAITLVESTLPEHQATARTVLDALLPFTGKAVRIGITGVPGAGKSTFIESFGYMLTEKGHRVAVLAVDPSSPRTGGSILGDKTRMERLSTTDRAFIRPSPSGSTLGGVARKTRECMVICEAAGYDVIIVETVGVGQSEVTVASMVDFFLVLMISGAGDELQGIKKGVLELADAVAINKADGDNIDKAKLARRQYEAAFHLISPPTPNWSSPVLTCSSLTMDGIEAVWKVILEYYETFSATGQLQKKRREQALEWMKYMIRDGLEEWFFTKPEIVGLLPEVSKRVEAAMMTPTTASSKILSFLKKA